GRDPLRAGLSPPESVALPTAAGQPLFRTEFRDGLDQSAAFEAGQDVTDGSGGIAPGVSDLLGTGPDDFPVQVDLVDDEVVGALGLNVPVRQYRPREVAEIRRDNDLGTCPDRRSEKPVIGLGKLQ